MGIVRPCVPVTAVLDTFRRRFSRSSSLAGWELQLIEKIVRARASCSLLDAIGLLNGQR